MPYSGSREFLKTTDAFEKEQERFRHLFKGQHPVQYELPRQRPQKIVYLSTGGPPYWTTTGSSL